MSDLLQSEFSLEQVWAVNDAFARLQELRTGDEVHHSTLESTRQIFTENIAAFVLAREEVSEILRQEGVEVDAESQQGAIYDTLAESPRGEDIESLCIRALYRLDGRSDREPDHDEVGQKTTEQEDPDVEDELPEVPIENVDREVKGTTEWEVVDAHIAGDVAATEMLIQRHTGIIRKLARKMAPPGRYTAIDVDDLFQEGAMGLLHATTTFDPSQGAKFLTYAMYHIRSRMNQYISKHQSTVRTPSDVGSDLRAIRRENTDRRLSRRPLMTDDEITKRFKLTGPKRTVGVYRQAENLTYYMGSIDTGYAPGRDSSPGNDYILDDRNGLENITTLGDMPLDEQALQRAVTKHVQDLLMSNDSGLRYRDREVLILRFGLDRGEPRTLEEVGILLGLTRDRIRQLESRALGTLRGSRILKNLQGMLEN